MKKNKLFEDKNATVIVIGMVSFLLIFILTILMFKVVKINKNKILDKGTVISEEQQKERDEEEQRLKELEDKELNGDIYAPPKPIPLENVPNAEINALESTIEHSLKSNSYEQGKEAVFSYREKGYEMPEELKDVAVSVDAMFHFDELFSKYFDKTIDAITFYHEAVQYLEFAPTPEIFIEKTFMLPMAVQQQLYVHEDSFVVHDLLDMGPTPYSDYYELLEIKEIKELEDIEQTPYFSFIDINFENKIETIYRAEFLFDDVNFYYDFFRDSYGGLSPISITLKDEDIWPVPDGIMTVKTFNKFHR